MKNRWLRALPLSLIVVLTAVPAAYSVVQTGSDVGPPDPNYTYMRVVAGKSAAMATVGTYCLPLKSDPTVQTCHTAPVYPLPGLAKITATRGKRVTLQFHAPVGYVQWRAARVSGGKERISASGEGQVLSSTKKSWTITLPKNLSRKVTLLGFTATYLNAYNTYEVGIKVR